MCDPVSLALCFRWKVDAVEEAFSIRQRMHVNGLPLWQIITHPSWAATLSL